MAALFAARRGTRRGTRAMLLVLSALWLWMAAIYHIVFFRPINPAATLIAGLFLAQAALLSGSAIRGNEDLGLAIAAGLVSLTLIYPTGTAPRSARAM